METESLAMVGERRFFSSLITHSSTVVGLVIRGTAGQYDGQTSQEGQISPACFLQNPVETTIATAAL